eukprot:CAMPEP_0198109748 /NCGR_PEP_ID=MMETSP1442-20131203/1801_1 /TAXON_ID= /ORGANISM="Craspedostauros australis, Strain CCMP3328" /LENGTH=31 /DNA_ID= /DNA_START= /DNA_END= /DNA_ORIENTATION=
MIRSTALALCMGLLVGLLVGFFFCSSSSLDA